MLRDAGFDVVAEAGDADDLVRKVGAHKPDVAIVDVRMPPDNTDDGLRAAIKLRARAPRTCACSSCRSTSSPTTPRRCWPTTPPASATCSRTASATSSASSTRSSAWPAAGRRSTPRSSRTWSAASAPDDPLDQLTPREREVLEQMAEGRSNAAIAEAFVVSERAVEKHVTSIFGKLGLAPAPADHRRVLAVLAYLRG